MAAESLRELRGSLDALLAQRAGKERECLAQGLDTLYSRLRSGQIPRPAQAALLEVARAASADDLARASRDMAALVRDHWEQHKCWLGALKRLLSRR